MWNINDYDSATARSVMRNAIHNIAYTVANSNTMQGMTPGAVQKVHMVPWQISLYAADAVIILLLAGGVFWMVKRTKAEKAHPEQFKRCQRQPEIVDLHRNKMSFFAGRHGCIYSPYTQLHLPA